MSKIELGKEYRTRDGREVRIYAVDAPGLQPVIGILRVDSMPGGWVAAAWNINGSYAYMHSPGESNRDLIEVRPRIKRTVWLNVLPDGNCATYHSRHLADAYQGKSRIACVKVEIDCEHGEGLA